MDMEKYDKAEKFILNNYQMFNTDVREIRGDRLAEMLYEYAEAYHQSQLSEMPSEKWLINFAYWIIDNVRTNDIVPWKVSEYLKQHLTESKQEEVKKNVGTDIPKDIDDTFGTLDNPDVF